MVREPMGTATYGGNRFKEGQVSGERPIRAASYRQQSIQASSQRPCTPRLMGPVGGSTRASVTGVRLRRGWRS